MNTETTTTNTAPNGVAVRRCIMDASALARNLATLARALDALATAAADLHAEASTEPAAARIYKHLLTAWDATTARVGRLAVASAARAVALPLDSAVEAARDLDIDHPARVALESA